LIQLRRLRPIRIARGRHLDVKKREKSVEGIRRKAFEGGYVKNRSHKDVNIRAVKKWHGREHDPRKDGKRRLGGDG